jgi:hypothetical protein
MKAVWFPDGLRFFFMRFSQRKNEPQNVTRNLKCKPQTFDNF